MAAQVTSHLVCCVSEHLHWDAGQRGQLGKSIASLMDRSWARNLQSPPRNHSSSLWVVPCCAQTHNEEHFGLFYAFMLVERRHYLNESSNLFYVHLQWICMKVLVCLSNPTMYFISPNSDTRACRTAGFSSCKIKLLDWPLWWIY